MSKRNALLVAVVAVLVVAVYFFWPERAKADVGVSGRIVSGRIGAGFAGPGIGARLHHGDAGVRRRDVGRGARGRLYPGGGHGARNRSVRGRGPAIGDRFLNQQRRRLGAAFLRPGDRHDRHGVYGRDGYGRDGYGRDRYGRDGYGRDRYGHENYRHRRGRHRDRWLGPQPLLLPYGGTTVIVREIIVAVPPTADGPVPVPAPRPRFTGLEPRGRVARVGEEDGIVSDWAPGDVLPDSVPHVTLDPVAYGLPQPPPGEKYARVGNDVLRIEAGSRRVTEVLVR